MSDGGISTGEAGGLFAGIVATATIVGAGIKWIWGEAKAAALTRREKLDRWSDELDAKEKRLDQEEAAYRARIEAEIAELRRGGRALSRAFELVAAALLVKDPKNQALAEAERILTEAFPERAGGV